MLSDRMARAVDEYLGPVRSPGVEVLRRARVGYSGGARGVGRDRVGKARHERRRRNRLSVKWQEGGRDHGRYLGRGFERRYEELKACG
jgi:hypothetical protein